MIRSAAAAAAALVLCGLAMPAPSAAGVGGGSDDAAARASLELRVGASELAAVPAASRALFAKVLGRPACTMWLAARAPTGLRYRDIGAGPRARSKAASPAL